MKKAQIVELYIGSVNLYSYNAVSYIYDGWAALDVRTARTISPLSSLLSIFGVQRC